MFFDMACPWICVFLPVGWVFGLQELLLSLVVVSPYFVHLRATASNIYRSLLITVSFVDTNMVPLMKLEWFEGMTTKKSPAFYQFSHLHWLPFQLPLPHTTTPKMLHNLELVELHKLKQPFILKHVLAEYPGYVDTFFVHELLVVARSWPLSGIFEGLGVVSSEGSCHMWNAHEHSWTVFFDICTVIQKDFAVLKYVRSWLFQCSH